MTVKQVAEQVAIDVDAGSYVVKEMSSRKLMQCLNDTARRSRVYWLTELGKRCQSYMREAAGLAPLRHDFPEVDWELYGWVCFSHRSAVIKALEKPLQPADIKRKALRQNPEIRMSANNVRDVIGRFLEKEVVEPVDGKGIHPKYRLTKVGTKLQALLFKSQGQWVGKNTRMDRSAVAAAWRT